MFLWPPVSPWTLIPCLHQSFSPIIRGVKTGGSSRLPRVTALAISMRALGWRVVATVRTPAPEEKVRLGHRGPMPSARANRTGVERWGRRLHDADGVRNCSNACRISGAVTPPSERLTSCSSSVKRRGQRELGSCLSRALNAATWYVLPLGLVFLCWALRCDRSRPWRKRVHSCGRRSSTQGLRLLGTSKS